MKKQITILALLLATIFANAQFANETTANGLIDNNTTCFAKAANGDLWIGTSQGLSKYSSGTYTGYTTSNGLINNVISAIVIDNYNNVWVGTNSGISVFDGVSWTNHNLGSSSANNIKDMFVRQNGEIWIATYAGVFVYSGSTFYNLTTTDGLAHNYTLCLSESNDETMWVGTAGGLCRFDEPGFTIYNYSSGMSANSVKALLATNDTIYAYCNGGLNVFDETSFTIYDNFVITSASEIKNIQKDENEDLLLGFQNGVTKIHNLQIEQTISIYNTNLPANINKIYYNDTSLYVSSVEDGYFYSNNIQGISNNNDTLNINNIKALINSYGVLFQGPGSASTLFEVPIGSGHHSNYASSIWLGGIDEDNIFRMIGGQFQGYSDWVSGPVSNDYYSEEYATKYKRVWSIYKSEIDNHITNWNTGGYIMPEAIKNWPDIADYFDYNTNGEYDPENGDYPLIRGDQAILTIFNDDLGNHTLYRKKMLVEVHALNYAFNSTDSALNNTIFTNYKIINKSSHDYSSVFLGIFDDIDIGGAIDDYMGSDTMLNSYYIYNGDNTDDDYGTGNIPAQSVTFLNTKMTSATYFTNGAPAGMSDPVLPIGYYNYLMGNWKDGTPMTYGSTGYGGSIITKYCFTGDPSVPTGWNENDAGNTPGDRRGVGISGPFDLASGQEICIDIAYVNAIKWNYTNLHSVKELKANIGNIHAWYNTQSYVCDSIITQPENTLHVYAYDTSYCENYNFDITLSSMRIGGTYPYTYYWEDETGTFSSTNENPVVSTPTSTTDYYVTITDDQGFTAVDTLTFTISSSPTINLGNDTSICYGDSLTISVPTGFDSYTWNTGNNSNSIIAYSDGDYSVTVSYYGCEDADELHLSIENPPVDLGDVTSTCINETLVLDASYSDAISYLWNTGETTSSINVNTSVAGQTYYSVHITSSNICGDYDDTTLVIVNDLPQFYLGNDTAIDETWSILLDAYVGGGATYSWSDGSNDYFYNFDGSIGEGTYNISVDVTDINGCSNSDEIEITVVVGLSVDENGVYSISIYPNPSDAMFNIKLPDNKEYKYRIIDAKGQTINNGIFKSSLNKVNLKGASKGVYFLIIDELNIKEKLILK